MVTGMQLFVLKSFQGFSNTKLIFVIHLNITLLCSTLVKRNYRTKRVDFQLKNSTWDIQLTLWPILLIK